MSSDVTDQSSAKVSSSTEKKKSLRKRLLKLFSRSESNLKDKAGTSNHGDKSITEEPSIAGCAAENLDKKGRHSWSEKRGKKDRYAPQEGISEGAQSLPRLKYPTSQDMVLRRASRTSKNRSLSYSELELPTAGFLQRFGSLTWRKKRFSASEYSDAVRAESTPTTSHSSMGRLTVSSEIEVGHRRPRSCIIEPHCSSTTIKVPKEIQRTYEVSTSFNCLADNNGSTSCSDGFSEGASKTLDSTLTLSEKAHEKEESLDHWAENILNKYLSPVSFQSQGSLLDQEPVDSHVLGIVKEDEEPLVFQSPLYSCNDLKHENNSQNDTIPLCQQPIQAKRHLCCSSFSDVQTLTTQKSILGLESKQNKPAKKPKSQYTIILTQEKIQKIPCYDERQEISHELVHKNILTSHSPMQLIHTVEEISTQKQNNQQLKTPPQDNGIAEVQSLPFKQVSFKEGTLQNNIPLYPSILGRGHLQDMCEPLSINGGTDQIRELASAVTPKTRYQVIVTMTKEQREVEGVQVPELGGNILREDELAGPDCKLSTSLESQACGFCGVGPPELTSQIHSDSQKQTEKDTTQEEEVSKKKEGGESCEGTHQDRSCDVAIEGCSLHTSDCEQNSEHYRLDSSKMEKGNHQKSRSCSPYRTQHLRTVEIRSTYETTKVSKNRDKDSVSEHNRKLPPDPVLPQMYMGHVQCLRKVFEDTSPREQAAVRERELKNKMYGSLREKKRQVTRDLPISPGVHGPVYSQVFNPLKKQFLEEQCEHTTFSNVMNSAVQHIVPMPQDIKMECTENNDPCTDTPNFQSASRNPKKRDAHYKHTRSQLQDLPSSIRVSSPECSTHNASITLTSPKGWKNENRVVRSPKAIIAQCLDSQVGHDPSLLPQNLEAFYFSPVKTEPWHNTPHSHRPEDADRPNDNWSSDDTDISDEQFKSSSSIDLVQDVNNHSFNNEIKGSKEKKRDCVSPIIIKKTQLVDLQYKDSGQSKNRKHRTNDPTVREGQINETKNELKMHNVSLRFAPKVNQSQENIEPEQNETHFKNASPSVTPRKKYRNLLTKPLNNNVIEDESHKAQFPQNISASSSKSEIAIDGSKLILVTLAKDRHSREEELDTEDSYISTLPEAVKDVIKKPIEEATLRSNYGNKSETGRNKIPESKTMEQITLDETAYESFCKEMSQKHNRKHNNHSTLCTEPYISEIVNETVVSAEDVMDHTLAEINQEGNVKESYREIAEKLTAQKKDETDEAVVVVSAVVPKTGTLENTQVIETSSLINHNKNMMLSQPDDVEKINNDLMGKSSHMITSVLTETGKKSRLQLDEDVEREGTAGNVMSQVHKFVSVDSTEHKQAEILHNQQGKNEDYEAIDEVVKLSQDTTVHHDELLKSEQAGDIRDLAALKEKAGENTTEYLVDNDIDKGTGVINNTNHVLLVTSLNTVSIGSMIITGDDRCEIEDQASDVNNHSGNVRVIVSTDWPVVDASPQIPLDEVDQSAYSPNKKSANMESDPAGKVIAHQSEDEENQVASINNQHESMINKTANNMPSVVHEQVLDTNIRTFTNEAEQTFNTTKVSDSHNNITSPSDDSLETVNDQAVVENVAETKEGNTDSDKVRNESYNVTNTTFKMEEPVVDGITNLSRDEVGKAADIFNCVNDKAVVSTGKESIAIQPAGDVYQDAGTIAAIATKESSETVSVQHHTIPNSMVAQNARSSVVINTSNQDKLVNKRDEGSAMCDVYSKYTVDSHICANIEPNFLEVLKLDDKNSSCLKDSTGHQVEIRSVNENLISTDHSRAVKPLERPCMNVSEITHLAPQAKNCTYIETDPYVVSLVNEETMRNQAVHSVPQPNLSSMENIEDVSIRVKGDSQVLADEEPEVSENMEVWVNRLRQLETPEMLKLHRAQRLHRASPLSIFATLPPIQEDQGSPKNNHSNIMFKLQEENGEPEICIPTNTGVSDLEVDIKNNMSESEKTYSWERSTVTLLNKASPLEMMRKHSGDEGSRSTAYKALITQNLSQRKGSIIGSLLLSDHLDKKPEMSEGKVYSRLESSFLLSSYIKSKEEPQGKSEDMSISSDDNNERPPKGTLECPQFQDTEESYTELPDKTAAGPVPIDIPISKPYTPITSQPKDLPDIWLNTKKEHGKLNPRPGKIILFSEPGFRGQKYEIYSDLGNTSGWKLHQSMSVRVIRGGWLLYEKPLYRGKRLMLLEGDIDLSCPWGTQKKTNTEDDTGLKKPWIGSLRHVVKDFQVPEISLFLEENGEGEKVKIVGPAPDTRVNGQPIKTESIIVHSGLWLLYSKPFFEGDPYILESGGYPNKKAWGGLDSHLCSLQPAQIGGPTVEKPNEPKLQIFQFPGFDGEVWEVTRDLHSVHGEPNSKGELLTSVGSLKVLGGCWVAYEKEGFRGHQYLIEEGEFRDWSQWGGCNEELGSIRLIRTDFSEPEIVLYEDPGCSEGPCLRLSEALADVEVAKYRTKTGSIHVLSGVWVAYENVDFSGAQYILEKGAYHSFQDWGAEFSKISSLQPVIQFGGHNLHLISKIQLFSEPNFHGDCLTFEENYVSLPKSFSPQSCRVEGGSWILYEGEKCSGEQYIVSEGDYPTHTAMGCLTICALRSLRKVPFYFSVPSISLHGLERFEGKELEFSGEVRSLQGEGYNNHVLSVRVESGIWVVYEHSEFRGRQWLLERTQIPNWLLYSGLQRIGSLCPIRQRRVYFRLKNHALGLFLCVPESSEGMKASRVLLTKANEGCCELWYYEEGRIKNQVAPHMNLQVIGQSCAGTKVVLWAEGRKPIQTWSLDHLGYIRSHTFQGMCLDVKGGQSYDSDHVVVWDVEEDRPTQRWDIEVF